MATAIPNPQKYEKGSFITLREALIQHKETTKWQRNTDINTFRSYTEGRDGWEETRKGLIGIQGLQGKSLDVGKLNLKKDEEEKEAQKTWLDGLFLAFDSIAKPLRSIQGFDFKGGARLGDALGTWTSGAERMNKGFKEFFNGIGALGPVFNQVKTAVHKFGAAMNMIFGTFQMLWGAIKALPRLFLLLMNAILNPIQTLKKMGSSIGGFFAKRWPFSRGGDAEEATDSLLDKDKDKEQEGTSESQAAVVSVLEQIRDALVEPKAEYKTPEQATAELFGPTEEEKKAKEEADAKKFKEYQKAHEEKPKQGLFKKIELKKTAFWEKIQEKKAKVEKGFAKKLFALQMGNEKKKFLMFLIKFLLPILALAGAFLFLKSKIDDWSEAPFAGIAKAGEVVTKKIGSIFTSLKAGLAKMFPKIFAPKVVKPPTPKPGAKLVGAADDVAKVGAGATKATTAAAGAADDVARVATKTLAKTVGKAALKRIPVAGAVVDASLNARANNKKFAGIKEAYENQTPIIPGEDGELRPMTADEFAMAEKSMTANKVGSAGAGAGALAGAAAGAAIGSVIPILGTAVGGIIGAVLGGWWGSKKGDEIATTLAGNAMGITDPQEYIDMLASNLPDLTSEAGNDLAAANIEVADTTSEAGDSGSGGTFAPTTVTSNSSTENTEYREEPAGDNHLGYSTLPAGAN